jgi:hypothetical protein
MQKVTIFENIKNISEPKFVNIEAVLAAIQNGRYKDKVEAIRACKEEYKIPSLKANLPCVLFAGEFGKPITKTYSNGDEYISYRDDKSLTSHSGFVPIDIDDIDNLDEKREELINNPYVYALWVSSSGKGLHGLVKIGDGNKHTQHYKALLSKIDGLDPTARNVSRVLYLSYDPDIYINTSCSVFFDIEQEEEQQVSRIHLGDGYTDYKKIDVASRMIRLAPDGQKHHILLKAAHLLGGYVATKHIEYEVAKNILTHEISKKQVEDLGLAIKTIEDGLRHGMTMPIAEIETSYREAVREIGVMEEDLSFLTSNTKDDDFIYRFRSGLIPMGLPFGYHHLDEHLRLKEGEFYAALAHTGVGKAQPLSSSILTPKGWMKFRDVKVGDIICDTRGNTQSVLGVFPQGERDVYKVTMSDNSHVFCDGDHLWSVNGHYRRHRGVRDKDGVNRYTPDMSFKTMKTTDMIPTVKLTGKSQGNRNNYLLPEVLPVKFDSKDVAIDPYFLGVLLGDGCIPSFSISNNDKELMDTIKDGEFISSISFYNKIVDGKNRSIYTAYIKRTIKKHLELYGLLGAKSSNKFIPNDYIFNDYETRLALLQGLMDTDGTVGKEGQISYSTISESLKDGVISIVNSLGGRATYKSKIKKYRHKGELRSGALCYEVQIQLPSSIMPFRLSRKIQRVPVKRRDIRKYISSIEFSHREECACIMVSNENSLYVTDNYIPTHNSSLNLWLIFLSAIHYDWNWMLYMGENSSAAVKMKMMEFFIGKKVTQMTDLEHNVALKFIDEHFFILSTENMYTYSEILEHSKMLMQYKSLKGIFIDPYNSLKMELTAAKNKYIYDYEAYSEMLNYTRKYNTTIFLSVHTTTEAQRDRDKDGNQRMPHASQAEGGSVLSNKVDNFMVYHRKMKSPDEWMYTQVSIDKVRSRETGGKPTVNGDPCVLRLNNGVEFVDIHNQLPFDREKLLYKHKCLF